MVQRTFQGDYDETCEKAHYSARCGITINRFSFCSGKCHIFEFGDDAYGYAHPVDDRYCDVEGGGDE